MPPVAAYKYIRCQSTHLLKSHYIVATNSLNNIAYDQHEKRKTLKSAKCYFFKFKINRLGTNAFVGTIFGGYCYDFLNFMCFVFMFTCKRAIMIFSVRVVPVSFLIRPVAFAFNASLNLFDPLLLLLLLFDFVLFVFLSHLFLKIGDTYKNLT